MPNNLFFSSCAMELIKCGHENDVGTESRERPLYILFLFFTSSVLRGGTPPQFVKQMAFQFVEVNVWCF